MNDEMSIYTKHVWFLLYIIRILFLFGIDRNFFWLKIYKFSLFELVYYKICNCWRSEQKRFTIPEDNKKSISYVTVAKEWICKS